MEHLISIVTQLAGIEKQIQVVKDLQKSIGSIGQKKANKDNDKIFEALCAKIGVKNKRVKFPNYTEIVDDEKKLKQSRTLKRKCFEKISSILGPLEQQKEKIFTKNIIELSTITSAELLDILSGPDSGGRMRDILMTIADRNPRLQVSEKMMLSIINAMEFSDIMSILKVLSLDGLDDSGISVQYKNFTKITRAYAQNEIEGWLRQTPIPFTSVTAKEQNDSEKRDRIFYTTGSDSIQGLKVIALWLKDKNLTNVSPETQIARLKDRGPLGVCTDLKETTNQENQTILDASDLEIGWGHLMHAYKHPHENAPFIVLNSDALRAAIALSCSDSTLVIDGHGGPGSLSLGDGKNKRLDKLKPEFDEIINLSLGKISHFILSSCVTGTLKEEKIQESTLKRSRLVASESIISNEHNDISKHDSQAFKARRKLEVKAEDKGAVKEFFEPLYGDRKKNKSTIAAEFAGLLFSQEYSECLAFTSSPSVLLPDNQSGNIGSISTNRDSRIGWPHCNEKTICWSEDSRVLKKEVTERQIAMKSFTLYGSKSRKALPAKGEGWSRRKKMNSYKLK